MIKNGKIICDKCNWNWNLIDGGVDPYVCHKCGHNNEKMKKVIKLNETDINELIKRVLGEQESQRYMFFSNLEQMKRQCEVLLSMNHDMIEDILNQGHDWAQDHIAEAKNNMDQVFDFLINEMESSNVVPTTSDESGTMMNEEKKKKNVATNQKLWKQSLAWAKTRYDVCPSAYCNGAAVKRYNSKGGKWERK